MTEIWTKWENQVVNGTFPLRRFLGGSGHSAVFLTESKVEGFLNAAIKVIPADSARADTQLTYWRIAASLEHPHLMRVLESGRCQLGTDPYLFVVMEHAEETLSETLPYRALSCDEVRELLMPTLDALEFLHSRGLVQGQLKPSNVLVVGDQLKLASDTLRSTGETARPRGEPTVYDPPEASEGIVSPAGDVWALGITMVEALTQRIPAWSEDHANLVIPYGLPGAYSDTIARCLNRDPTFRPTIAELRGRPKAAPPPVAIAAGSSVGSAAPNSPPVKATSSESPAPARDSKPPPLGPTAPQRPGDAAGLAGTHHRARAGTGPTPVNIRAAEESLEEPTSKRRGAAIAIAALIVLIAGIWAVTKHRHNAHEPAQSMLGPSPATSSEPASESASQASAPEPRPEAGPSTLAATPMASRHPVSRVASNSTPSPATDVAFSNGSDVSGTAVLHEEIPSPSRSARETIHGHIKISVRVIADPSGKVTTSIVEYPGPSRYFERLASAAAGKWQFAPADSTEPREWLLLFEFSRDGTSAHATPAKPRTK